MPGTEKEHKTAEKSRHTVTIVTDNEKNTDTSDSLDTDSDHDSGPRKHRSRSGGRNKENNDTRKGKEDGKRKHKSRPHHDNNREIEHNSRNKNYPGGGQDKENHQRGHNKGKTRDKRKERVKDTDDKDDGKRTGDTDTTERSKSPQRNRSPRRPKPNNRSLEAQHMKQRLVHLTGSDSIRVNDRDYMEKLRRKLWQEHEDELKRKEVEREENERQRMRKLLAKGIIGPEDMREDATLWTEYRRKTSLYDQKYKGKRRKKSPKSPRKDAPDRYSRAKSAPVSRKEVKKVESTSSQLKSIKNHKHDPEQNDRGDLSRRRSNQSRAATSFSTRENDYVYGDSETRSSRQSMTSPSLYDRHSSVSRLSQDTERDSSYSYISSRSGSSRRSRYEHPIIRQMREEQTVAGLYDLAEQACPDNLRQKHSPKSKSNNASEEKEYAYDPNKKVKIKF